MLQTRTIEPGTLGLLKQLMKMPTVDPFYLVGGTSLALQLGHRFSIDLDLFTIEDFDKQELLESLIDEFDIRIETETKTMIITNINDVKVDFVKMAYPILFPTLEIEGVRMLDIRDIAPMKLKAVVQRGSKKDLYDIFFLLKSFSLNQMINLFQKKFKQHETFHVIKSLTYFNDAEQFADPIVFDKSITWELVKSTIRQEVKNI